MLYGLRKDRGGPAWPASGRGDYRQSGSRKARTDAKYVELHAIYFQSFRAAGLPLRDPWGAAPPFFKARPDRSTGGNERASACRQKRLPRKLVTVSRKLLDSSDDEDEDCDGALGSLRSTVSVHVMSCDFVLKRPDS